MNIWMGSESVRCKLSDRLRAVSVEEEANSVVNAAGKESWSICRMDNVLQCTHMT